MAGRSLREIRGRIDELADESGRYGIVCGRTGERIVPVADARFEDRAAAAEAAKLAEEYRAALRRYDPRVMVHDPIVRDASASSRRVTVRSRDRPRGVASARVGDSA